MKIIQLLVVAAALFFAGYLVLNPPAATHLNHDVQRWVTTVRHDLRGL